LPRNTGVFFLNEIFIACQQTHYNCTLMSHRFPWFFFPIVIATLAALLLTNGFFWVQAHPGRLIDTATPTATDTATLTSTPNLTSSPTPTGATASATTTPATATSTTIVAATSGAATATTGPVVTATPLNTGIPTATSTRSPNATPAPVVLPTIGPQLTSTFTPPPPLSDTHVFTNPPALAGPTATWIPFPTITLIFPESSPTTGLQAQALVQGTPGFAKPQTKTQASFALCWPGLLLVGLWLILIGGFGYSRRKIKPGTTGND
jgi:hypothetical protein